MYPFSYNSEYFLKYQLTAFFTNLNIIIQFLKVKHISKISVTQFTPRGGSYYVNLTGGGFEPPTSSL